MYSTITSVTQQEVNRKIMHLIQYEDKELVWINLKDSLHIFRFQPVQFHIIEEKFSNNELNKKMGIEKDFISHFS